MQEYYETKKQQGRASFIHNTMPVEEPNKISSLDKTDSLYFHGGPQDEEGKQTIDNQDYIDMNMQSDEIVEGFMVDTTPSIYPKSEQVFLNNLRTSKRKGDLSRDQCRQLRLEARQLDCIRSDRFRSSDSQAELLPEAKWERH